MLLAAVWLQTTAHSVLHHSSSALCEHSGAESVCTCVCHAAYEPAADAPFCVEPRDAVLVSASDETVRGLLLPNDIFRPPLTNS